VTSMTRPVSPLCRRYAQSLLKTALDNKAESNVSKDMEDIGAMLERDDVLSDFVDTPIYSRKDQMAVIEAIAKKAKFHKLTVNFLKTLVDNKRLSSLANMVHAYQTVLREHNDEIAVNVRTAYELKKAQLDELTKTLKTTLGKNVILTQNVEKDLLGGMVVTVGSVMIDDSVKGKLERLKLNLKTGTNENANMKEVG